MPICTMRSAVVDNTPSVLCYVSIATTRNYIHSILQPNVSVSVSLIVCPSRELPRINTGGINTASDFSSFEEPFFIFYAAFSDYYFPTHVHFYSDTLKTLINKSSILLQSHVIEKHKILRNQQHKHCINHKIICTIQ